MEQSKKKKKVLDKRILDHTSSWRTPFAYNTAGESKLAVLIRIGEPRSLTVDILKEVNEHTPEVRRVSDFNWWKLAACLVFITAVPFLIEITGRVEIRNAKDANDMVLLPDGSSVNMTPGSELKYNKFIWTVNRRLDFEGAGYFEVAEGSLFRVCTEVGEVRVLGTSFSVWTKPHLLFVQCTGGEVEVETGDKLVRLKKDQFTTSDGEKSVSASPVRNIPILPENSDLLTFEGTPLGAVFAQLSFKSGLQIQSELNPDWLYSGTLNTKNRKESFELLCKPFGATYEISTNGIVSIKR